jgi:hypothetical protein
MATFAEAEHLLSLEPGYASPQRDPRRVRALEQRLAIRCPRSTREWYERDDSTRLLARYSNSDHPIELAKMFRDGDRLIFMNENQGVCRWAFRLDDSDDPEVLVQTEREPWQSCNCKFAGFVAAQFFDWAEEWAEDSRTLQGDPPTAQTLRWLAENFRPGPVARQRSWATHRFFDDRVRIYIYDNEGWFEWWVRTRSFADMDRLLDMLQPFYDAEL